MISSRKIDVSKCNVVGRENIILYKDSSQQIETPCWKELYDKYVFSYKDLAYLTWEELKEMYPHTVTTVLKNKIKTL